MARRGRRGSSPLMMMRIGSPAVRLAQYLVALGVPAHLSLQEVTGTEYGDANPKLAKNIAYTGGVSGELLTNNTQPITFTADGDGTDTPTGWSVLFETPGTDEITEVGSGQSRGGAGTGAINFWMNSAANLQLRQTNKMTIGHTYRDQTTISANTGPGLMNLSDGAGASELSIGVGQTGQFSATYIAEGTDATYNATGGAIDCTIDSRSLVKIGEYDAEVRGGVTISQAGLLGANHAYDLDGSTGFLGLLPHTTLNGMTEFTLWLLFKADTLTNGDRLWFKSGSIDIYLQADGSIVAHVDYGTTDAETVSDAGVITTGAWHAVGVTINDTDKIANINVDGVSVNDTVQAGAGTRVSNTNILQLGKDAGTGALDGLVDEAFVWPTEEVSAAQFQTIAAILGTP